ncbi:MAG: 4-demethylwyosine synthase TYW1, partial [Candidatus Thermoplasmatota archaeon]|nr:4-demethylwyosine synthase TYW1 [Candidatus Thermoplasmatota archaeon]
MQSSIRKRLEKQHYAIVGNHSGVKLCHWLKQSLIHKRYCYKQSFYGIQSHRCLQMTPTLNQCNHSCSFCWRYQGFTETELSPGDDPVVLLPKMIQAQRKLITGFKGDPRCDQNKWEEANKPNMVACSLSGEPTLYPQLGRFFYECHKQNMTTFLVTNGTTPKILEDLDPLPSQLYVSLVAPNEEIYKKLCHPSIPNGWEKIKETLALLPSLETRTVIRHTLINEWNINDKYVPLYARLIEKANPDFVESKGYVFVGQSRKRMTLKHMPTHDQ